MKRSHLGGSSSSSASSSRSTLPFSSLLSHHAMASSSSSLSDNPLFAALAGSSSAIHEGVTCDGCSTASFSGIRHKCSVCFDYDLCDDCYLNGVATKAHDPSHAMQTILPSGGPANDFDQYIAEEFEGDSLADLAGDRDAIPSRSRFRRDSPPRSGTTTFKCPYCTVEGFVEQDLVYHVNSAHGGDSTPVVCPICAAKPGGDPMYISRNFHGHLDLRHSQSDDRSKRLLNRAAKGLFATSAMMAGGGGLSNNGNNGNGASGLGLGIGGISAPSSSRIFSELAASKHKNPPSKVARLANLPPVPVKIVPPPTTLLPSLEPSLTEEEIVEANNKKILKGIFLRELLFSTLVEQKKKPR